MHNLIAILAVVQPPAESGLIVLGPDCKTFLRPSNNFELASETEVAREFGVDTFCCDADEDAKALGAVPNTIETAATNTHMVDQRLRRFLTRRRIITFNLFAIGGLVNLRGVLRPSSVQAVKPAAQLFLVYLQLAPTYSTAWHKLN